MTTTGKTGISVIAWLLATLAVGCVPDEKAGAIKTTPDRFNGRTAVRFEGYLESWSDSLIGFYAIDAGGAVVDGSVGLMFRLENSEWTYMRYHPVALIIDGRPTGDLPSEWDGDVHSVGNGASVVETVLVVIPASRFRAEVSVAKRIEYKVGSTTGEVPDRIMPRLRQFATGIPIETAADRRR